MKTSLAIWVEGARPKTLFVSVSPVLIGASFVWKRENWNLLLWVLTLLSALLIQTGTNFANDYLDGEKGSDQKDRIGPRRLTPSGIVSSQAMKKATFLTFGLACLCGLYLSWFGGAVIAVLTLVSITCGFCYTGGPYPLSYHGLGDLFVFLFFGPIATCGTAFLQTGWFSTSTFLAGIGPGLLSTALLVANHLRDYESDLRSNKKTIPVRFGRKVGRIEYLFCILGAACVPLVFALQTQSILLACVPPLFLLFSLPSLRLAMGEKESVAYVPLLSQTAKLLFLYTIFFVLAWTFSSP